MDQTRFEGRWSGGESAATAAAIIVFEAGGLSIGGADGAQVAFWSYDGLIPAAPIARNAQDVLLRHSESPRATLFIEGAGVGRAVIARAPKTAQSFQRVKIVSLSLIVTLVAVAAGAYLLFGKVSVSKTLAALIPAETANRLGLQSIELFGPVAPACIDQPGNKALSRILDRLRGGGVDGPPFTLHIAKSPIANAFALPGRHIVLLSGLLKQAKSPEEVAGVIAHEMGHHIERDPEALFVRRVGIQVLIEFLTGQSGSQTPLAAGALLLQLRYSREAEATADAHAVEILRNARVSALPTASFFSRDPASSSEKGLLSYLSTHPSSKDRAKLFQSQPPYPTEPILAGKEWADAQAICG